jgi:hypothetical protein
MATTSNLFIDQGSYYTTSVTVTGENGSPIDLTGYTVSGLMRKSYASSRSYPLTCTIAIPPTQGIVKVEVPNTDSSAMPAGRYLYDIEVTNVDTNHKLRVVEGLVIISPEITR